MAEESVVQYGMAVAVSLHNEQLQAAGVAMLLQGLVMSSTLALQIYQPGKLIKLNMGQGRGPFPPDPVFCRVQHRYGTNRMSRCRRGICGKLSISTSRPAGELAPLSVSVDYCFLLHRAQQARSW